MRIIKSIWYLQCTAAKSASLKQKCLYSDPTISKADLSAGAEKKFNDKCGYTGG
jgi:hypothetical protein